jgi:hypothetical protein
MRVLEVPARRRGVRKQKPLIVDHNQQGLDVVASDLTIGSALAIVAPDKPRWASLAAVVGPPVRNVLE